MSPSGLSAQMVVDRGGFRLTVDVEVAPGEVLAVLGPNGAGKTTLLRTLAGLIAVVEGHITVDADIWDDARTGDFRPAADRRVGVVFQDYRLFPHLSVLDNVAFSAHARGATLRGARRDAACWLERLELEGFAARRPGELSGGQAQRVALARALACEPALLLLDEPLAALDARSRLEIRGEIRRHLSEFAGPSILVTHDPLEAMVLADRILVLESGRAVQEGTPAGVARHPATQYVARLVGLNLYPGTLTDRVTGRIDLDRGGSLYAGGDPCTDATISPGTAMLAVLAPSAISLHTSQPDAGSPRNRWTGVVAGIELLTDRVRIAVEGRPAALVDITPAALADLHLVPGQPVWLSAKATAVVAYRDPERAAEPAR